MITSRWTQFAWHVHRVIQEAFATEGKDPEAIARVLVSRLKNRPTAVAERERLERFVRKERQLFQLLHFTLLGNVPNIMRFGIVPRAHLTIPAVRIAINPVFSDERREDGHTEMNCLSMSYPNYGMFYRKRRDKGGDWAVLKINPSLMADRHCVFTPSNAARGDIQPRGGIEGARLLFCNSALRRELGLQRCDPTDPQSEILEDSVIEPRHIMDVAVETESARRRLAAAGVESAVEPEIFQPRADYRYWQSNRLAVPIDDYPYVLAYELEQDLEIE